MDTTKVLPGFVGTQRASRPSLGWRAGQLSWVGRVAALCVGMVAMATAVASPTAAAQTTNSTDGARGTVNAEGGRVSQTPVTQAVDYVALGDSYSSGVGTGIYDAASGACQRSPLSYPPLWVAEHHPASFAFVACSGATTADVRANQIAALEPTTDLVTITIGGNDAGFGPVLQTCTAAESDRTCFAAVDAAEAFERTVLRDRLARTYAAIRAAAPQAHVIVLGYPRLFELTPSCADPLAPNLTRRSKLNEGADVLNSVIRSVSQQHGLSFTDMRDRFAGHGVCSTNPWINGPSEPATVGPYHPNQTGYRDGYLDALDATTTIGNSPAA
jgi:lysophospholipase L1-like esterase